MNGNEYSDAFTNKDEISQPTHFSGSPIEVHYNAVFPSMSTTTPGVLGILFQGFCCVLPFLAIINGILYLPKSK